MKGVRVAALQMESVAGDKSANFRKLVRFAEEAAARGVEIVVSPECGLTGYWFLRRLTLPQLEALAEPVPDGPSCARLLELASRLANHGRRGARRGRGRRRLPQHLRGRDA